MINRFERFSVAVSELSKCLHKIAADELEKHDLKGSYAIYFTTLYRFKKGITSVELSEVCGRDKADVSRAVSVLEKKGLMMKLEEGSRIYRAKLLLTQEGRSLAEHIIDRAERAVELGGKGLSDEHREVFYCAMDTIIENLQRISQEGLPE